MNGPISKANQQVHLLPEIYPLKKILLQQVLHVIENSITVQYLNSIDGGILVKN